MALNDIMIHDDDANVAGSEAQIDALDFIDGGDVPIIINGEIPTLMCIDSAIYDDHGSASAFIGGSSFWQLLPPTWPSTLQLGDYIDMFAGLIDNIEGGDDTYSIKGKKEFIVKQDLNIAHRQRYIGPNTTWVNAGDSIVSAATAAADFCLVLHQQYKSGGVYPYRGGPLIHIRKTVAAASITSADVWDNGLSEVLSDDSPALDPDKMYRLHAITGVAEGTTPAEFCMGVRFSVTGADQWHAIGLGSASSSLELAKTIFLEDSVPPFQGNRTVKIDILTNDATTDDYLVGLWLEEYGDASGGGGGDAGTTAIGGATAARSPLFTANAGSGQPVQPAGAGLMNFRNLAQMFKM